jgi:hypothetical protein
MLTTAGANSYCSNRVSVISGAWARHLAQPCCLMHGAAVEHASFLLIFVSSYYLRARFGGSLFRDHVGGPILRSC